MLRQYSISEGFHTPRKIIRPKLNKIEWLEFELADHDATLTHVTHCTSDIPPKIRKGFETTA